MALNDNGIYFVNLLLPLEAQVELEWAGIQIKPEYVGLLNQLGGAFHHGIAQAKERHGSTLRDTEIFNKYAPEVIKDAERYVKATTLDYDLRSQGLGFLGEIRGLEILDRLGAERYYRGYSMRAWE